MSPTEHILRHVEQALGDDPRLAIAAARKLREEDVPWLERRAVRHARSRGYGWGRIGRLLMISRQAARQRLAFVDTIPDDAPFGTDLGESQAALVQAYNQRRADWIAKVASDAVV